jgi:hypothetical protein
MTLCPVALVSGCKKCVLFQVCPLKGVIGDYRASDEPAPRREPEKSGGAGKPR